MLINIRAAVSELIIAQLMHYCFIDRTVISDFLMLVLFLVPYQITKCSIMHLLSLNYALIYMLNKGHYVVLEKKCKLLKKKFKYFLNK